MVAIYAGERWWVAVISDGDDNHEETDPFEARDDDDAWTKARQLVSDQYDPGCYVDHVEPYTPQMTIVSKSKVDS